MIATVDYNGTTTTVYHDHTDHLTGTGTITSSTPAEIQTLDYFAFGEQRINDKAGTFDEQIEYAGSEYDGNTSLNYMNARYYNGNQGRFISEDAMFWALPMELLVDPQQQNSYSYARNNPIVNRDPTGNLNISEAKNVINSFLSRLFNPQKSNTSTSTQPTQNNNNQNTKNGSVDYGQYNVTSPELRNRLDRFANDTNQNIIVTSGDRSIEGNKSIGGATASRHISGDAADIKVKGVSNEQLSYMANKSELFNTTIYYPATNLPKALAPHAHVDINPSNNNILRIYSPYMKDGLIVNSYKPLANPLLKNKQ
ncbi:hypothetical protein A2554_03750 [Candidatus Nomurabacteria bacterium RIFOXYD2_FULL_35_12]|nr:MAG: hypothetical protein A2554_03750 [Candidatus Nomurabacteria bacterium RIFOXYD2_FULL_35_12]